MGSRKRKGQKAFGEKQARKAAGKKGMRGKLLK
jgi:hypothetical protein